MNQMMTPEKEESPLFSFSKMLKGLIFGVAPFLKNDNQKGHLRGNCAQYCIEYNFFFYDRPAASLTFCSEVRFSSPNFLEKN